MTNKWNSQHTDAGLCRAAVQGESLILTPKSSLEEVMRGRLVREGRPNLLKSSGAVLKYSSPQAHVDHRLALASPRGRVGRDGWQVLGG